MKGLISAGHFIRLFIQKKNRFHPRRTGLKPIFLFQELFFTVPFKIILFLIVLDLSLDSFFFRIERRGRTLHLQR